MSSKPITSPSAALLQQAADLHKVLKDEEKGRLDRWKDELPSLESLILGLTQTRDLLKKEKKRIQDEMNTMKTTHGKRAQTVPKPSKRFGEPHIDVVDLQKKLIDMNNRVLDVNLELEGIRKQLDGIIRDEERLLYEAKFVVLQDTKRILQDEINEIREEIFRRENQAQLEEERKAAESSGWADLNRLEEQLARLEGRIDRAKQGLYFPHVKGYRFNGGGGGVYTAAKDLYVAELSGRFLVSCEKVFKADGSAVAKLSVVLGGASFDDFDSRGGTEGSRPRKSRQHQQYAPARHHMPSKNESSAANTPEVLSPSTSRGPSSFMDDAQRPQAGPADKLRQTDNHPLAGGSAAQEEGASGSAPPVRLTGSSGGSSPTTPSAPNPSSSALDASGSAEADFFNFQEVLQVATSPEGASQSAPQASPRRTDDDVSELEQIRRSKSKKGGLVMKFLEGLGKSASITKRGHHQADGGDKPHKRSGSFWKHKKGTTSQEPTSPSMFRKLSAQLHKVPEPQRDVSLALQDDDDLTGASSPLGSTLALTPLDSDEQSVSGSLSAHNSVNGTPLGSTSGRQTLDDASEMTSNSDGGGAAADLREVEALLGGNEFAAPEQARKGVHLTLLGHGVAVMGERGTKVPNITVREIAIEVEAVMSASFTYDTLLGWEAPEKVAFEISHLDRKVSGNNIPLPRALIQAIINYTMPSVIRKLFLSSLPLELGKYVLDSGEAFHVSGEIRMIGPSLPMLTADLAAGCEGAVPDSAWLGPARTPKDLEAAQKARAQIGLTDQQALVLSELFSSKSGSLMDTPRALTLNELSRFYLQFVNSKHWQHVIGIWGRAVQLLGEGCGMNEAWLVAFLTGPVARLAKKPLRVSVSLDRLDGGVDADIGMDALRDYCERTAREYQKTMGGSDDIFRESLDAQLAALALWHQGTRAMIRSFKARFRSAGLTLLVAADSEMFQFGAERVHYEGPLKYQLAYPSHVDSDGNAVFDIKLPDPNHAMQSSMLRFQTILEQLTAASLSARGGAGDVAMDKLSPEMRQLITRWQERAAAASPEKGAAGLPGRAPSAEVPVLDLPILSDSTIGRVLLRRLTASLKLDERRMGELLTESIGASLRARDPGAVVAGLMAACGPLLSLEVDTSTPQLAHGGEEQRPQLLFHIASNDVTLVHAQLESALFQSVVSPKIAITLLHAVVVGVAHQFHELKSRQVRWLDRFFRALADFLSRDVLDTLLCLSVKAAVEEGRLRLLFGSQAAAEQQQRGQAQQPSAPLYFMNDVNLLSVMDNVRSFMDAT